MLRSSASLPGSFTRLPQLFQVHLVAQGIHRLPETAMKKSVQLTFGGQAFQRLLFPGSAVVRDVIDDLWRQYKIATVDPGTIALRLFLEAINFLAIQDQRAETARRLGGGQRGQLAVRLVERDRFGDVDITDAVAIGEAECLLTF